MFSSESLFLIICLYIFLPYLFICELLIYLLPEPKLEGASGKVMGHVKFLSAPSRR